MLFYISKQPKKNKSVFNILLIVVSQDIITDVWNKKI